MSGGVQSPAGRVLVAPACILVTVAVFTAIAPGFWTGGNLLNVLGQMWVVALLATGQMFALATRGFDISVGAVAGLASVGAAYGANAFGWAGLLSGALVGLACGTLNGILIGSLGMAPIIATLATLVGSRGISLLVTDDGQAVPLKDSGTLARWVFETRFGLPPAAWVALAIVALAHVFLTRSLAGRHILMFGSNPEAVKLVGIDDRRVLRRTYALCGLFAGFAGTLTALRAGAGLPVEGSGMELQSIAAAVIGGTPLTGGVASVPGVAAGALFMQILLTGLNISGLSPFVAQVAIGLVIISAGLAAAGLKTLKVPTHTSRRSAR